MKIQLPMFIDRMRSTLWFVPALMTSAAGFLAVVSVRIDQTFARPLADAISFLYSGGPDGAREILSATAGSMITIAGVSFSIVIVALSLASNNYGSRLLRNFMRDRGNQVVLGTFIATYIYCLLVLGAIRSTEDNEFVPYMSVTIGIGLALCSLGVLIYFIHHVSESIQAEHVVKVVADELDDSVEKLFPEHLGAGDAPVTGDQVWPDGGWKLTADSNGYLQIIDAEDLLEIAERDELQIELVVRPGTFLTRSIHIATVFPEKSRSEELEKALRACFDTGLVRTTHQDIEFALDQLVEVAVRALSPGINDPFTAAACLDRLLQGFTRLVDRRFPDPIRHDETGRPRLKAPTTSFEALLDRSFEPIRHYGRNSPMVLTRMNEVIEALLATCEDPERSRCLRDHARETKKAASVARESFADAAG